MTSLRRTLLLVPLLLTSLGSTAGAQVPVARWDSPDESGFSNDPFYRQLSDIDGDGFPEILFPHSPGSGQAFEFWAYSMDRNQLVYSVPSGGLSTSMEESKLLTLKDLDGDGLRDFVATFTVSAPSPPNPRVTMRAYSGRTGTLLWEQDWSTVGHDFGPIGEAGDVTGDGVPDIASVADAPLPVKLLLFSGKDGTVVTIGSSPVGTFDGFLRPAGDIDQDGYGDVVARFGLCSEFGIFSGRTGQMLVLRPRRTGDGRAREYVVGVGDANGDGVDDWAEGWNGDNPYGGGGCSQSVIKIFSGLQATEIGTVVGKHRADHLFEGPFFHFDFDGDGTQDLVFRGTNGYAGGCGGQGLPWYVSIHSLGYGVLREWAHDSDFGPLFAMDEDWDGDQHPDVLAWKEFSTYVFGVPSVIAYSTGVHVAIAQQTISQSAGGTLDFQINAGTRFAGRQSFLLLSTAGAWPAWTKTYQTSNGTAQELALPFVPEPLTGTLWALSDTPKGARYSTTLDTAGRGTITLTFAPGEMPASWIGRKVRFTAVLDSDAPGFPESATEAAVVVVTP